MKLLDRIAYDTGGYTVQEILSSFCKKILEIIDLVNKNEEVCDEARTIIENIRNEVVPDLVDDIIKEMQDNGYFDRLVNVTLIEQLRTELTTLLNDAITDYTSRLDNVDSQLEEIETKLQFVTYDMFNPKCDGISDDGIQIKACHDYANEHNIPVINTKGKYYIKDTRNIEIKTIVDWGLTEFVIDETTNTNEPVFRIKSKNNVVDMPYQDVVALERFLKPNVSYIDDSFISHYNDSLIVVEDINTVVCTREHDGGLNNNKQLKEFFYVSNKSIIGDLHYDFQGLNANISSCKVYKCDSEYLTIEGGKFILSGNNTFNYSGAVIKCERSRTIIKNIFSDIENETATHPRNGFINSENCYDVTVENIKTLPNKTIDSGTYKLVANTCINIKFNNITCMDMGDATWGCIETSWVKDVFYTNCNINRIDTHWYISNLTVENCKIGSRGINICGFGQALFKNVTRYGGSAFITPRWDYGAVWDGDIVIRDCKFVIPTNESRESFFILLHSCNKDYDFNLQSVVADNIIIDNFIFVSDDGNENKNFCILGLSNTVGHTGGAVNKKNIIFPSNIDVRNVFVKGRSTGVSELIRGLFNPEAFQCRRRADYSLDKKKIETNSNIFFENIQCKKHAKNPNAHGQFIDTSKYVATLSMQGRGVDYTSLSLKPRVHIKKCREIVVMPFASEGIFIIEDCTINHFDSYFAQNTANQKGRVYFNRCIFKADTVDLGTAPFRFRSELGTFLSDCFIDIPVVDGAEDLTAWLKLGFCDGSGWQLRGVYNNVTVSDRFTTNAPNNNVKRALMHTEYAPSDDYLNYIPVRLTYGPTTSRPNSKYLVGGDTYFDVTLGKQITWSGSDWKDSANGNKV